ncbi:helix-turn-helix domain-containing protein [Embleya sp. AB8]|uniref:helix-turn-helix domain-containing protein n=1 Tax=Embleya sp. AB8 TaxID=3156304 RepID=UPI003C74634D
MGRKQRTLNPTAGPVAEFALQLRGLRERAGNPTFATMSRRAHRSTSALSEAAGGVEFPTWATVEAFVQACGETNTACWLEHWERAREALKETAGAGPGASGVPDVGPGVGELLGAAPLLPASAGAAATASPEPSPARRRRLLSTRGIRTAATLAVGIATGLVTGVNLPRAHDASAAPAASPKAMPTVVIVPMSTPPPWPATGSGCATRTRWVYQFDHAYQGQVYVLLATPGAEPRPTEATITWGAWQWHQTVNVAPGDPTQSSGGALLLFNKLDTNIRNPLITIDTTAPTCVAFGTAGGTSVAPQTTIDANQGWVGITPSPAPDGS